MHYSVCCVNRSMLNLWTVLSPQTVHCILVRISYVADTQTKCLVQKCAIGNIFQCSAVFYCFLFSPSLVNWCCYQIFFEHGSKLEKHFLPPHCIRLQSQDQTVWVSKHIQMINQWTKYLANSSFPSANQLNCRRSNFIMNLAHDLQHKSPHF